MSSPEKENAPGDPGRSRGGRKPVEGETNDCTQSSPTIGGSDRAPNRKESLDFLRWWGNDLSVLTAIPVTKKKTTTNTFPDPGEVKQFLIDHVHDNVYFTVNPVMRAMDTKPSRSDIRELAWLHVDIDPRPGEEVQEEQARALEMLTTKLPPGVPPPSAIVFSGGGYQGFWRLKEPFEISGQEAKYEEAKRWNMQLEILFNGDNCHNVDRIMRLPGTINWPTARKQAKGRVPAEAKVVEMNDLTYDLREFTPAPEVTGGTQGFTANTVKVSGNVQKLGSVDDLGDKVSDKCKVVIVQGNDPDDPGKWPSRSECLFWVCCELVRAGVDDDTIFSVLMDSDFRISDSVLDKGSNAGKYAVRQIERAREDAIDPWLRELNEKHFVVGNWGGKCRVAEEVWDPCLKRPHITKQSFADFMNRYCNKQVQLPVGSNGKLVNIPAGKWWIVHPNRRTYERLAFAPGQDLPPDVYNLWQGFGCCPGPGSCDLYLDHVLNNVCRGEQHLFDYLLNWMAAAVQRPNEPGHVAIVTRGRQGVGKGVFAGQFGRLFGRHYLAVSHSSHLVGNFNAHLRDCVVLFADEAFFAGDNRHRRLLKSLVTEDTLVIEGKGNDAELSPNYLHIIMASNDAWVVPAEHDDRRYFVLDVGNDHAKDIPYFKAIVDQMDGGGREALLQELLHRNLSGFEVRDLPETDALREQKERSMLPEDEWVLLLLEDGVLPNSVNKQPNRAFSNDTRDLLKDGLYTKARLSVPKLRDWSDKALGRVLREWGCERSEGGPRYWAFPPLAEMRRTWEKKWGSHDWPGGSDGEWQLLTGEPFE